MARKNLENILIMVAHQDESVREFVTGVLESYGFDVIQAIHGGAAIKVIQEHDVDVAIIGQRLKMNDGFEVAKHILVKGRKTGVVMLTQDPTTDLLLQAGQYGIAQVMRRPVEPERLLQTVRRMLRKQGKNIDAMGPDNVKAYSHEELMDRAIALGAQNAKAGMGGPFGAVVADKQGHLLGEGVNGVYVRADPTAHAEVLAIRSATDKVGLPRLDDCVIYCSSEPTMLGQALIISCGIDKVYYGISHEEAGTPRVDDEGILSEITKPFAQRSVPYEQLKKEPAMEIFLSWKQEQQG